MLGSSIRQGNMNKENRNGSEGQEPGVRITRARARALGVSGGAAKTSVNDQKGVLKVSTKRQASEETKASAMGAAGVQCKRRAVLKEVTNTLTEDSYANSTNATKAQTTKQAKKCPLGKSSKVAVNIPPRPPKVEQENLKTKLVEGRSKVMMAEAQEIVQRGNLKENQPCSVPARVKNDAATKVFPAFRSTKHGDSIIHEKQDALVKLGIQDIDTNFKDPLVCSLYAPDIYKHIRVTELNQRPSADYMEILQRDVTPNMRGILIDWLVEVSEEYKLVPDTLYLTVNLIDRYLSKIYIEKQRLQLLGVTCMLIASKYEEICAPRVEEFCFITDNTYTKEELLDVQVLEMESRVLNLLHFQLSVPTPKTLLRRFIQAAQTSYKDPCVELELLANYLAELTLVEYNFIKILPSLVAASAVFLARWTLNQSDNPWNPTLEHYTNYKAPELKSTVLALEDLQLNVTSCPLNAIREKYRHQKFKSVADLTSPERVQLLFDR
ncbi:CYCA2-2 [Linum grandiflorum]